MKYDITDILLFFAASTKTRSRKEKEEKEDWLDEENVRCFCFVCSSS